jgi:hypothetical protein
MERRRRKLRRLFYQPLIPADAGMSGKVTQLSSTTPRREVMSDCLSRAFSSAR